MKKYIIVLVLSFLSIQGYSQRMVYKQKAIEVNTGILLTKEVSQNYYINLTINSFAKRGNYWIWGIEYQTKTVDYKNWQIPLQSYLGEIGYSTQLLADTRKVITLNMGLTGVAGYEIVNRGDSVLLDGAKLLDKSGAVYGTAGRLSLETYLTDRVVFLLQGRIKVLWGSDYEKFRPSAGIGFRFNF